MVLYSAKCENTQPHFWAFNPSPRWQEVLIQRLSVEFSVFLSAACIMTVVTLYSGMSQSCWQSAQDGKGQRVSVPTPRSSSWLLSWRDVASSLNSAISHQSFNLTQRCTALHEAHIPFVTALQHSAGTNGGLSVQSWSGCFVDYEHKGEEKSIFCRVETVLGG